MNNQPIHLCTTCQRKKCKLRKSQPEVAAQYLVRCSMYAKPVPPEEQLDIFKRRVA